MHRMRLYLLRSATFTAEEEQGIQTWLAACPPVLRRAVAARQSKASDGAGAGGDEALRKEVGEEAVP